MRASLALGLLAACGADDSAPASGVPVVTLDGVANGVAIYRDGDGPWQLADGAFEVTNERYAVALIDPSRKLVDAVYSTVTETPHVSWTVVAPPTIDTRRMTGLVRDSGLLPGSVGSVGSATETAQFVEGDPYELEVPVGLNTILFGRLRDEPRAIDSLIVRRDIPIVADTTLDADFVFEGLPTVAESIPVEGGRNCVLESRFVAGRTSLLLDANLEQRITYPNLSQWSPIDRLSIAVVCDGSTSVTEVSNLSQLPAHISGPQLVNGSSFALVDNHFEFALTDFFTPIQQFELSTTCFQCARWTSHIDEAWLSGRPHIVTVLSPPDLDELGLLGPALELATPIDWTITARAIDDLVRTEATISGTVL